MKRDRGDISSEHQEVNLRWHLFVDCFKAGSSIWKSEEMWGTTVAQRNFLSYCTPKGQFFYASFFVLASHRSHFKNWTNKKEFLNFKHRLFLLSKVMSATYFSCHEGVGAGKEQTCAFSSVRVLEIPNFSKLKSWCRFFPKSLHHSHCTL